MGAHLKYLKYVLRHKFYVYQAGRKLGLGCIQLLLHDFQKFLPSEWFPYTRKFYGGSYPDKGFKFRNPQLGNIRTREQVNAEFDLAWLHHQKLGGKHHWQWWVLHEDDGDTKVLPMPDKYRREMLADWRGAGRAIHGKDETPQWYEKTKGGRKLHPATQAWIEGQLGVAER